MTTFTERKRWLFLGLPFTFTKYTVRDDMITIDKGLFRTTQNDCYMYKVVDVKLERSLAERLVGLGTVVCYTGDTTDKKLLLCHIKNAKTIKDFILKKSEQERIKRRTINTLNLNSDEMSMGSLNDFTE